MLRRTPRHGNTPRYDGTHEDTNTPGLYCRGLLDGYDRTKDPLFRDQAVAYLKAYAHYGFDEKTGKFWGCLVIADGSPGRGSRPYDPKKGEWDYRRYEPRGPVDLWQPYTAADEQPLDTALTYARAAKLTGDAELLLTARRWAEYIAKALPPGRCRTDAWYKEYAETWGRHGAYAEQYGKTISFFVAMARLTGETKYADLARSVADDAVSKLYYKGLFRGHPCKQYYESVDGVGYLLQALLQLQDLEHDNAAKRQSK